MIYFRLRSTTSIVLATCLVALHLSTAATRGATDTSGNSTAGKPAGPEVWRMTVRPKATARPALENSLLPRVADQTEGNAATMYLMAFGRVQEQPDMPANADALAAKGLPKPQDNDLMWYYLDELPLDRLPADDVENYLNDFNVALGMLATATHRDYCRWEIPLRETGVETLLTHLNPARRLANAVALRARLHVARKQYPQAIADLRMLMRMSRDLTEDGVIVQVLVGTGIAGIGNHELRELVQQPDAPNLYWPLANLPRPLFQQRTALEWDRATVLGSLPQLKKAETQPLSAEDWTELVSRLARFTQVVSSKDHVRPLVPIDLAPAAAGAMLYPEAKRTLVRGGLDAAAADAMTVPDVLGKYMLGEFRSWYDEVSKWTAAPYWEARDGLKRTEAELARSNASPLVSTLLAAVPSVSKSALELARLERQFAMLQTVEALRAYAAAHEGKLPGSLEELGGGDDPVPAAQDPTSGKSFAYHANADAHGATLESPAPEGESPRTGLRVELTLGK